MDLIGHLLAPRATYAPWENFWYDDPPSAVSASGMPVGEHAAMHVSAFFDAVRNLSETVAQVPLILYERTGEETKEIARETRLYEVLHDQPNGFQSSYEYRLLQTMSMLLGGNAYSEVLGGHRGAVDKLRPLLCGRMRPQMLDNGRVGYMYRQDNGSEVAYTQDEIFHVRAFPLSSDGVIGHSLMTFARETIGMALASEAYGSRLFKNDAKRQGNFSVPGTLNDDQRTLIKKLLRQEEILVLESGATWVDRGMTPQDIEFLLSRKFSVIEMARYFNLPPHRLKDLERATFSNIEHQGLEFLQYTMIPYFVNWEQAILRDLIVQKKRFFAKFLIDGLVRADIKTRYEAYSMAINSGFGTRNQFRSKEDWNRIEGLDAPLVDQNKAIIDKNGNIVPVNKPEPAKSPPPGAVDAREAHYRRLLYGSAERVMRKEAAAIVKALGRDENDPEKLASWADKFYGEHSHFLAEVMQMSEARAQKFAQDRKDRFLLSVNDKCVSDHLRATEQGAAGHLLEFVINPHNGNGAAAGG